jgi:leucyl-tRNA synthetase
VTVVVQVNGKVRERLTVDRGTGSEELQEQALSAENVKKNIDGKAVVKIICVPDKLVNIVVR